MARTPQSGTRNTPITVDGLGAGWANPVRLTQIGLTGLISLIHGRGDVGDATAGNIELQIFRAPHPGAANMIDKNTADVTAMDPGAVVRSDIFLNITGFVIAPHATAASDEVNLTLSVGGAVFSANNQDIWISLKGVLGEVHFGVDTQET